MSAADSISTGNYVFFLINDFCYKLSGVTTIKIDEKIFIAFGSWRRPFLLSIKQELDLMLLLNILLFLCDIIRL